MLELRTNTFKIKYHLASDILKSIKQAGDYSKFHQAFKPVVFTIKDTNKDEDPCFVDTFTKEVIKGVHYASVSFADVVFEDEDPEEWVWLNYELYYNDKFEIKLFERQGDSLFITRENLNNKQYPMNTLFKLYNIACDDNEGLPYFPQPMQNMVKKHIQEKLELYRANYFDWKINVHYKNIVGSYKRVSELLHTSIQCENTSSLYSMRIYGNKDKQSNDLANAVYKCFAREWTHNKPLTFVRERCQKSFGEECNIRIPELSMMDYANIKAQMFMMRVLKERYLVFESKEGKLVLMDIETQNFYSFYSDILWVEPEDIRDAVIEHLDYLNEHPWMEEVISEKSYKVLMECADILSF